MYDGSIFREIANLLTLSTMMGHQGDIKLKQTLIHALAADTHMPPEDVEAFLLLAEANREGGPADNSTEEINLSYCSAAHHDGTFGPGAGICRKYSPPLYH